MSARENISWLYFITDKACLYILSLKSIMEFQDSTKTVIR